MAQKRRSISLKVSRDVRFEIAEARKNKLRWLDLSSRGLQEVPEELRDLPHVNGIDLTGNQIAEVPAWLGASGELTWVGLIGNPIRADGLREVNDSSKIVIDAATAIRCSGNLPYGNLEVVVEEADSRPFAQ
jgi:hypothetical protein